MLSTTESHVCGKCAADDFLAEQIGKAAVSIRCDYCGSKGREGRRIAAPVEVLTQLVMKAVYHYWTDPADELPFESAEDGYQGKTIDTTRDLLVDHIGVDWPESLLDKVANSFEDDFWCKRHYFNLDPDERILSGWQDFEKNAKHESRYTSLLPPLKAPEWVHPDELSAADTLAKIETCIQECGLVSTFPIGTTLFRARAHKQKCVLNSASDLGAPKPEQAAYANRMSAAGIAVFYGAMDRRTAIVETFDPEDTDRPVVTTGQFKTVRALNILNLGEIPFAPSYFDLQRAHLRYALRFLRAFVRAVSRPTVKDGREHINYVPTQIFAEYVRHRMRHKGSSPIHGIIYPSSRLPKKRCCVLFCDQSACGVPDRNSWKGVQPWVVLQEHSVRRSSRAVCLKTAATVPLSPTLRVS